MERVPLIQKLIAYSLKSYSLFSVMLGNIEIMRNQFEKSEGLMPIFSYVKNEEFDLVFYNYVQET